ncbi:MAG: penicillin-binding protein [Actinomycetales bacterium]|nr:penicillin-binding protein [Actinomycetales bacterium]
MRQELTTKLKLSAEDIDRGGLRITTTINKKAQDAAVASVDKNFPKSNTQDVYAGLAAVRPGDGAVVAMYGGADYQKRQFSAATDAKIPAGSTFKPFALIAALQQGLSTKTTVDGSSPMKDKALGIDRIENEGGRSYGTVDLRKATASSINTAFVRLNAKIGAQATRDAAVAAGIPESTLGLGTEITNVLGNASPRVLDVANAYASIAAEGRRATPYLVKRATSPAIGVDFTAQPNVVDAFGKDVAADVIDAMQAVTASGGTGARAQQIGRPSAGKTGTSEERKSVWFSGYTPQLSTSVAM